MRCQLLFARDERPGVLVLDCIVSDGDPLSLGLPCAIEVDTPGRSLADQIALLSIRRWSEADAVRAVHVRMREGQLCADVYSTDGAMATAEARRIVGLRRVGDRFW